jgi:phosphotriesterase-related protein
MTEIQTVTGPIAPESLGRTLMHEHLVIGYPGFELDWIRPGPSEEDRFAVCVDRIEELKELGITALLDPCPIDLGRDVEFIAKVAQRTSFQIVCATGLYKEEEGQAAYWKFRGNFGDQSAAMAELFIKEIVDGVGSTGVRAGILKVGTGHTTLTDYERAVFAGAAQAAVETGVPITTHTDRGRFGDDQQAFLVQHGVEPQRIVIGHSCGTSDHDYHLGIAEAGSYLGFDRFGLEMIHPDADRAKSVVKLIQAGFGDRVVVSHDSVWCWRGSPIPSLEIQRQMEKIWNPTHFLKRVVPMLRDEGATDEQIEALLVDNPRRFFAGDPLPARAA